jgi:hypothetical protein
MRRTGCGNTGEINFLSHAFNSLLPVRPCGPPRRHNTRPDPNHA